MCATLLCMSHSMRHCLPPLLAKLASLSGLLSAACPIPGVDLAQFTELLQNVRPARLCVAARVSELAFLDLYSRLQPLLGKLASLSGLLSAACPHPQRRPCSVH